MLLEIILGIAIAAALTLAIISIVKHKGCCHNCAACASRCPHGRGRMRGDKK